MTITNKRIKNCEVCGELFEDKTRPGNKLTCSRKCGDERRKARQRQQYRIDNPKKPTQRDVYYYDHLEYPFWLDDRIGDNQSWKVAVPYSTEKIEQIASAKELYDYHGGRIGRRADVSYDGDEKGSHKVSVNFGKPVDREPSEVTSYTMTPEELAEYLAKRKQK